MNFSIRKYNLYYFKKIIILFTIMALNNLKTKANSNIDTVYILKLYDNTFTNYESGNFKNAIEQFKLILKLKSKTKTDIEPQYYKIYNWMGILHRRIGEIQMAINYFDKALLSTNDSSLIPLTYTNLAITYSALGDYTKSIDYYKIALNLMENNKSKDVTNIKKTYHNLGYTYLNANQYEKSLTCFLKSIQLSKENNLSTIEITYFNIALAYQRLNKFDEAEKYYLLSIKGYINKYGKDYYMTSRAKMYYASLLAEKNNFSKSLKMGKEAYNTFINKFSKKHPYTSECLETIGNIYTQKKEFATALTYYQKALIARVKNFNDTCIYTNPAIDIYPDIDLIDLLKAKALTFEKLASVEDKKQNLSSALSAYKLVAHFIYKLRTGYQSEQSKLYISSNEYNTHLAIIKIAEALYRLTGDETYKNTAFEYAERSRYGVLKELVNEEKAKGFAGVPAEIIEKERKLKEQVNNCRLALSRQSESEMPDSVKVNSLTGKIFDLSRKQEELIKEMEQNYPAYYQLKYDDHVITPSELQNSLDTREALVEYTVSGSLLYTFLFTKEMYKLSAQPIDSSFYKNLEFYNTFLHSEYMLSYDSFRIASFDLYETLIAPFEPYIQHKNLLIVPDISMGLMSFESLVDEPYSENSPADYSRESYLVKKYPIGYAFSATLLAGSKKKEKTGRNRFLGFAPLYKAPRDTLENFPGGAKNLKRLAKMLVGRSFTGYSATEKNFKKYSGHCNILHIYAHGQENRKNSSLSKIYMATPNDSSEDGILYAYEISNIHLNAKMVVLASCYSGSGRLASGEGVMSIGRSFFNAGSKSVVLSLWGSPVIPALEELTVFYKHLLLGKRKDEAMRIAKLRYLKKTDPLNAQPGTWANLVVIGNQDALYHHVLLKVIVFLVVIGLLIALLIRARL